MLLVVGIALAVLLVGERHCALPFVWYPIASARLRASMAREDGRELPDRTLDPSIDRHGRALSVVMPRPRSSRAQAVSGAFCNLRPSGPGHGGASYSIGFVLPKRRRASRDWVRSAENENWVRSAKTERVTRLGSFPQEPERAAPRRFGRTKPSQKLQGFRYGSKRPRRGRGVSLSHRPRE